MLKEYVESKQMFLRVLGLWIQGRLQGGRSQSSLQMLEPHPVGISAPGMVKGGAQTPGKTSFLTLGDQYPHGGDRGLRAPCCVDPEPGMLRH